MTEKEKAESRLNCFYAAVAVMEASRTGKSKRPTTEEVLKEAQKIADWVVKEEK
jgi:hypothetical protein